MSAGPAGPRTARLINDRRAYDLLRERGPLTRAELRTLTGLSRPSVGDLVARLSAQGLITVVGESGSERRGPNASLYGVIADRSYAAGVEVRASTVSAVVVDMAGHEVGRAATEQTEAVSPDRLVAGTIDRAARRAGVPREKVHAIVVGTPGLVDPRSGDVSYVSSLPRWHANLLPGLRQEFDVPVMVENEVNLVGLAEQRLGAAAGWRTFALVWFGTGVGSAIVLDGRLHRGVAGGAGEVAYAPVNAKTTAQDAVGERTVRELADRCGLPPGGPLADVVEAGASDPRFVDGLVEAVSLVARTVCAVLDPGLVVLAGPVGRAGGAWLANGVGERMSNQLPSPISVLTTELEGNPVVRGAMLVALDTIHDRAFAT